MLPGVSKTSILTMRARVDEHHRDDRVFEDPLAVEWWAHVQWPDELDDWYAADAQSNLALRADDIDHIIRRYVDTCASAPHVVELGCGLSTRRSRLGEIDFASWSDLDLPPVAELRSAWGAEARQIGRSVLDFSWMDEVGGSPGEQIFVAEGLLYYLSREAVNDLFAELARRFPGSVVVMDVLGSNDFRNLLEKTSALGTPIVWKLERPYEEVLGAFGLEEVEDFEPERITSDMLRRYWERFDKKVQGAIFFGMNTPVVWSRRSGDILGRLARSS